MPEEKKTARGTRGAKSGAGESVRGGAKKAPGAAASATAGRKGATAAAKAPVKAAAASGQKAKAGTRGGKAEAPVRTTRAAKAEPARVTKAAKGEAAKGAAKPTRASKPAAAKPAVGTAKAAAAKTTARAAKAGAARPASRATKAAAAKPTARAAEAAAAKPTARAAKAGAAKPAARAAKGAAAKPTARAAKAEAAKPTARAAKAEAAKPTARAAKAEGAKPTARAAKAGGAKPAARAATAGEAEPTARAAKAETTKPTARAAKAEAAKPTARAAKAEAAKPTARAAKAEAAKPTARAAKAEAAKPTARASKAEAAKPAARAAKAEAAKPAARAAKAEAAKPAARAGKAEAAKPTARGARAEAAKPTARAAKAEAAKPTARAARAEAAKPTARAATAEAAPTAPPPASAEPAKPTRALKAAAAPAREEPATEAKPGAPAPTAAEAAAAEEKAAHRRKVRAEQEAAAERNAARRRKAQEEQAAAVERKAERRRKAEEEQAAAVERKAERRRKVEAEQAAAAERKAERRSKAEAEQAAAAGRKAGRAPETAAPEARAGRRGRGKQAEGAPAPKPELPPQPTSIAAPPSPLPPTPIAEAPVEGKGRRAVVDSAAVAELLGDAADAEAPLVEATPPLEPWELELRAQAEVRRREKEEKRAARAKKHEDRRKERKQEREQRAEVVRGRGADVIGTITVRPEGYGFLKRLEGPPGDDIFLPPDELHGVMDGDRLRVRLVRGKFGRDAGQLLEVLDRRRRHLLGTFYRRDRTTWVVPVDPTLPRFVPVRARGDLRDGQIVKVSITQYPEPGVQQLLGDVEKVVGDPGDPIVEVLEVAYSHGFAEDFPADVRDEAELIPDHVLDEEKEGRRDLTGMRLVTIDGEDARDFDDAVYVEKKGSGYRLVVAIADVSHYVRPGSRLDEEALHRATSVYFPNHVLPMLPERLSNGICSLNPKVDRLCMVADITFDAGGRPLDADVYQAVMNSHARCTYEQVAEILEGKEVPALDHVRDDLVLAGELAKALHRQRVARGALDFDLPEAKPVLDERMQVVDIVRRPRNDAHRLIEEFMLAANEAVARWFGSRALPTVYRVHGEPDPAKLENFVGLANAVGFHFDLAAGITPVKLGEWLREIEGSPQQKALNTLLLRSMMQAVYTPENIGHFGLGAEHYLHFTSPIRRYPDLLVHRLLKLHWAHEGRMPSDAELEEREMELGDLAAQASLRERAAMEAEREIDAYFKCRFVEDKVGEIHDATIVSITDFGFFAEIDAFPVDGLVRAEELGTQWELDPRQHRLVFGSGLSFGVGEHVQVEIAGVDLAKRQIGFVLVTDQRGEEVLPIRPRNFGKPRGAGGRSPTWVEAPPPRRHGKEGGGREEARPQHGGGREEARPQHGGRKPWEQGAGYGARGGAGPAEERGAGRREHRGYGDRAQRDRRREGERGYDRGRDDGPRGPGRFADGDGRSATLTDAIDRVRGARGKRPGPPAGAPGAAPVERRGSRFAAGDRQAAWGAQPTTGRFAPSGGEERRGGKKGKKGKGKQRPGRKERQARRRR